MRKLRLELDALKVETFETRDGDAPAAGTVRAHDSEPTADFNQHTCDVMSCAGTCLITANVCGECGWGESIIDVCE